MKSNRNADWLARAVIVAMFAVAALAWPSAPAEIPIHWNIVGQVNGYGSKFTGLLLMPIVALAGAFGVIVADARGANLNMNYVIFPVLAVMMIASANLLVQLSRLKMSKTAPPGGEIQV